MISHEWYGLQSYESGLLLQKKALHEITQNPSILKVLFMEHETIFTGGPRSPEINIPYPKKIIDRGGLWTCHEPGQLVGYPILHLETWNLSIKSYVSILEKTLKKVLDSFQCTSSLKEGLPGLWIQDKKIASIGIRVINNITTHGFSLNVNNSLEPFQWIQPCGLNITMTSLKKEGHNTDLQTLAKLFMIEFQKVIA